MRGTSAASFAILLAIGLLAPAALGGKATGACASNPGCRDERLPAPITITNGRVTYRMARDGTASRVPAPRSAFPRAAIAFPATGTWYMLRREHLVVGRGRRALWRSHERIRSRNDLGVIMANSHLVAFQHDHRLYLARRGGVERPVASREMPLGWTTGGFYTYRYRRRQLLLRSDTGRALKVIARRPLGSDYLVANGSLYFIAHGELASAHGKRTRRLASLAGLGVSAGPWLAPIGRLLELEDNSRLLVVRPDGSLFARIALREWRNGGVSSTLVVAPHASAVAFTATSGRARGTESVYLLRAGAHTATEVHRESVQRGGCERGVSLQWHGKWLLYSNTNGNLSAIDTTGAHRAIELTGQVRALLGARDGFSAYWSGQMPAL